VSTPRDWDAETYDRIANPMARWGATVVERLPLTGSERVLDAGCGSGRVTEELLRRLPNGSVVALDASPQMVAEARRRLAVFGERVEYVVADLAQPLSIAVGAATSRRRRSRSSGRRCGAGRLTAVSQTRRKWRRRLHSFRSAAGAVLPLVFTGAMRTPGTA